MSNKKIRLLDLKISINLQAALIKDVNLATVKAKPLELKVHSDYIAAYGENKEEYVRK